MRTVYNLSEPYFSYIALSILYLIERSFLIITIVDAKVRG